MARRYLLPCGQCDQNIVVETTQAGQTVTCSGCEKLIKVGTLRDIKALSSLESQSSSASYQRKSRPMDVTNRIVFVISVIALALGGYFGVSSTIKAVGFDSKVVDKELSPEKIENLRAVLESEPATVMLSRWEKVNPEMVATWVEDSSVRNRRLAATNRFYALLAGAIALAGLLGVIGAFTIKGARAPRR